MSSNLLRFPNRRKAREEASWWLASLEEGIDEDDRTQLTEWLAADASHAEELIRLARVWDSLDLLRELSALFPLDQYRLRRGKKVRRYAAAAALVLALGGASAWWMMRQGAATMPAAISVALPERSNRLTQAPTSSESASLPGRGYETAIGEQLSARLPDGSVVTLNTDTRLEVVYSDAERLITMQRGEANFRVATDQERPFRVLARGRMVQAVGTVFNVHAGLDALEVTVSEGRVRVTSAPAISIDRADSPQSSERSSVELSLMVTAGELAVLQDESEAVRRVDRAEIEARLAWQQGMLVFRGEPLERVLAEVSRYTTVKFTVADESIRTRRVGGYFRAGDIDSLLVALRESFDIETRRVGDEIQLTAR